MPTLKNFKDLKDIFAPEPPIVPVEPTVEVVVEDLPRDAAAALYKDRSGPARERGVTEGKANFGSMVKLAREAAGLDIETGLPLVKEPG